MKEGFKTTEFWVTLSLIVTALATLLSDLIAHGVLSAESKWVGIAGAALAAVYTLARSMVKGKTVIKLVIPMLACFGLVGCSTTAPDVALEVNAMRHANMVETLNGVRAMVQQSTGSPEFKAAFLDKLRQAERVEVVLHTAMHAYLKAEAEAMELLERSIEKMKGMIPHD